jgi:hypothetical protein
VTAVLLLGYSRPESILQRINEIASNNPSHLYVSIDKSESPEIRKSVRLAVESALNQYPNPTSVSVTFRDSRLGLSSHITTALNSILENERRIIILEDDIKIGPTYLTQMTKGYETFSDNPNFGTIGGFSGVPIPRSDVNNYWRRTKYFSAWGWMTSVATWEKYQLNLPPGDINNQLRRSESWMMLSDRQKKTWLYRFEKVRNNPGLTWDFQMQYLSFKFDLFNVLPVFRICENLGFGDSRSTNTKEAKPKWMQSDTLCTSSIKAEIPSRASNFLSKHVDSFTISGDSSIRQNINWIRRKLP